MQIAHVLRTKGSLVSTMSREATVAEAIAEMAFQGIGALVISADGDRIEGIVSERDIVRAIHIAGPSVIDERVDSVMSSTVAICHLDDDIHSVMTTMTDLRVRHLPVVVDGHLVGIVSIGDVVKERIDELEREARELVDYINAR